MPSMPTSSQPEAPQAPSESPAAPEKPQSFLGKMMTPFKTPVKSLKSAASTVGGLA